MRLYRAEGWEGNAPVGRAAARRPRDFMLLSNLWCSAAAPRRDGYGIEQRPKSPVYGFGIGEHLGNVLVENDSQSLPSFGVRKAIGTCLPIVELVLRPQLVGIRRGRFFHSSVARGVWLSAH